MPSQEIRLSSQQRRAALAVLDRNRLSRLTEQLGLEVEDRRVIDHHIHALLSISSVDFAQLLGQLKREELQAICTALGLDPGGREKELLIQRILGQGGPQQARLGLQPPPAPPAPPEEPAPTRARAAKKNGGDLGFEGTLWKAADELRGNMDAAVYKHVVLGLIFLKYVSDAFEERHTQLLAEVNQGADPEDPDEYRAQNVFWVPREARWAKLKANARQPVIGKLKLKGPSQKEALMKVPHN